MNLTNLIESLKKMPQKYELTKQDADNKLQEEIARQTSNLAKSGQLGEIVQEIDDLILQACKHLKTYYVLDSIRLEQLLANVLGLTTQKENKDKWFHAIKRHYEQQGFTVTYQSNWLSPTTIVIKWA